MLGAGGSAEARLASRIRFYLEERCEESGYSRRVATHERHDNQLQVENREIRQRHPVRSEARQADPETSGRQSSKRWRRAQNLQRGVSTLGTWNEAHRSRHRPHILQVRLRLRVRDCAPRRGQENSDQHEQDHPRSTTSKRHRGAHRPRVHHNQKGERFREEEQLDVILDASGQTDREIRHFKDREMGADIRERVLRGGGREKREKEAARWR